MDTLQTYISLILEKQQILQKGFSLSYFEQLTKELAAENSEESFGVAAYRTFLKQNEYLMKYLRTIGEGSSRKVFLLSTKKVIKLSKGEKGYGQNKAEVDVAKRGDGFAKIFHYDHRNFTWLESELVRPISDSTSGENEFQSLTGMEWYRFRAVLWRVLNGDNIDDTIRILLRTTKGTTAEQGYKILQQNSYLKNLIMTCQKMKLRIGDLVLKHFGKTTDGRVVVYDYGYTEDVFEKYYA